MVLGGLQHEQRYWKNTTLNMAEIETHGTAACRMTRSSNSKMSAGVRPTTTSTPAQLAVHEQHLSSESVTHCTVLLCHRHGGSLAA